MKSLITIGIPVGILAALWMQLTASLGLVAWVGFLGWACYFAAGGKWQGLVKTIPAGISGALWGAAIVWAAGTITLPAILPITVGLAAFGICVQANWRVLSFIPGAFAGCAAFFGTNFDLAATSVALICGAFLGWLSEYGASRITSIGLSREASINRTRQSTEA